MEFFDIFLNSDTIHTLPMEQKMIASLVVTLIGMGVTFVGLIVIQYLIRFSSVLIRGVENRVSDTVTVAKSPMTPPATTTVVPRAPEEDEVTEELVAVLTAAVAASLGTTTSNIVIRNIRRVGTSSPAWAAAGRSEQLANRF